MKTKLPLIARALGAGKARRLPDLGERELLVLEVLWRRRESSAQSVLNEMPDKNVSLSTVQSTLERLHRKRLVERCKVGRAYHYSATLDRSELISGLLNDMAQQFSGGDLAPMISGFINFISSEQPDIAATLSQSLQRKTLSEKKDTGRSDD